ncbi:MAG: hypothetical protein GC159_04685 [Phycisphaera sp.]|nr:hypothetical protein [Phycisphaera sp.]
MRPTTSRLFTFIVLIGVAGLSSTTFAARTPEQRLEMFKNNLAKVKKEITRQEKELKDLQSGSKSRAPRATTSPGLEKAEKEYAAERAKYDAYRAERVEALRSSSQLYRDASDRLAKKDEALAALNADENATPSAKAAVMKTRLEAAGEVNRLEESFLKDDEKLGALKDQADLASYRVQSEKKKLIEASRNDDVRDRINELNRVLENNRRSEETLTESIAKLEKSVNGKKAESPPKKGKTPKKKNANPKN